MRTGDISTFVMHELSTASRLHQSPVQLFFNLTSINESMTWQVKYFPLTVKQTPFFFTLVLSLFFLARVISSLAYPNLFGNKRLSCCCCGYSQTKDCVPVSLIQSLQEIVIAKFILVGCISNELIYARAFESNHI
jgi:hypothetical protein